MPEPIPKPEGLVNRVAYASLPLVAIAAGFVGGYFTGRDKGYKTAQEDYRPLISSFERLNEAKDAYFRTMEDSIQSVKDAHAIEIEYLKAVQLNKEAKETANILEQDVKKFKAEKTEKQRVLDLLERREKSLELLEEFIEKHEPKGEQK